MNAPTPGHAAEPAWVKAAADQSRLAFGLALTELGRRDERVVAVSADTLDLIGLRGFIDHAPERVIDVGIAEQNAMGVAAGLATTGLRPFVCGYAPFISARSMEQVRNEVAYANQRVVIGAAASGVSLAVSGGTHHALEDLALMRSFPNMTVLVSADAHEAWHATLATDEIDGPVYLRLGGRVPEPPVTPVGAPFSLGKARCLAEGSDVAVIACGALAALAVDAATALAEQGVGCRVLNMSTIKPLDEDAILAAAEETRGIVTAEEHHLTGGLGGAVAELLAVPPPHAHAHGRHARRVRRRRPHRQDSRALRYERPAHRGRLPRPDGLNAGLVRPLFTPGLSSPAERRGRKGWCRLLSLSAQHHRAVPGAGRLRHGRAMQHAGGLGGTVGGCGRFSVGWLPLVAADRLEESHLSHMSRPIPANPTLKCCFARPAGR